MTLRAAINTDDTVKKIQGELADDQQEHQVGRTQHGDLVLRDSCESLWTSTLRTAYRAMVVATMAANAVSQAATVLFQKTNVISLTISKSCLIPVPG